MMATLLNYRPNLESRFNGEVVRLLLEAGADAKARKLYEPGTMESVLHTAVAWWKQSMLPLLIRYGADVNASGANPAGQTALHIAAQYGNEDALRELIRAGADVSTTYANGKTALHVAAAYGRINTASILLDQGLDIMAKFGCRITPVAMAATNNMDEMVRFLLDSILGTSTTWPMVGIGRDTSFPNWSEERAEIARNFLRECHCPYRMGSLPKRVIRVGSASEEPRLYISNGEHYMTLSHSWGGVSPIITTTDTLSQRMRAIPYKKLPKTFQDAVIITRSLGVNYLWIDSLCILQDSQEDWQREAAKMKDVYANCYAMIAADGSPNAHGGCFTSMKNVNWVSHAMDSRGPWTSKVRAYVRLTHLRDPFHMEICHRIGDLHDPRIVAESLKPARMDSPREGARATSTTLRSTTSTSSGKESRFKGQVDILLWTHFVKEFTQRRLSYSTDDILHALSGLASYMAVAAEADYVCGIWKKQLAEFLLWRGDYLVLDNDTLYFLSATQPFRLQSSPYRASSRVRPRRHVSYYAPSWSWASIIGPITFQTGRLDTNDKDQVSHIRRDGTIERVNRRRVSLLEAVEIECVTDSLNQFGPPRHASLTARCQTVPWIRSLRIPS
ncbi:hypothetical protein Egran_07053 [Elaphomyces granulatus]|uniref:Heterokaryon incompatibility domain-containing protein n=1 Tax=Elaphomyces granulatus TaxID=519963 RepID=A0A232LLZ1_9EURO|nr:hypothetical protein Egran_07053 [Elaphomyces granulatus]